MKSHWFRVVAVGDGCAWSVRGGFLRGVFSRSQCGFGSSVRRMWTLKSTIRWRMLIIFNYL